MSPQPEAHTNTTSTARGTKLFRLLQRAGGSNDTWHPGQNSQTLRPNEGSEENSRCWQRSIHTAAARANCTETLSSNRKQSRMTAGMQGSKILHRKMNVIDDGKRNQNPEHQEEVDMFARSSAALKSRSASTPQPNNREEQNQSKDSNARRQGANCHDEIG